MHGAVLRGRGGLGFWERRGSRAIEDGGPTCALWNVHGCARLIWCTGMVHSGDIWRRRSRRRKRVGGATLTRGREAVQERRVQEQLDAVRELHRAMLQQVA